MEASLVVSRFWNPRASAGQQLGLALASPSVPACRNGVRAFSSFRGQQLSRRPLKHVLSNKTERLPVGVARSHSHHHHPTPTPGVPPTGAEDGAFLDDMSRFVYKKISAALQPYLPKDIDYLDWLPEGIHSKLHNSEAAAILVLREFFHFGLFYFVFIRVDGFCKWLHWLYNINVRKGKNLTDEAYQTSNFNVMTGPLRLLVVVWAGTRLLSVCAPLLRIKLGVGMIAKTRETAIVVALTWFCFKWKQKYVEHLTTVYKLDAPRIIAFDKVVSLLMYFVALSCIGEVNGFALRSLLAVGGFSGVALGLAAKEIVSNFFGGALLFITRPFVIGERIKAGNTAGYVQDIGFLQTKILSTERVPMIVPNQSFINQAGNTAGYVQDIGFLQTKILSTERVPMIVPNQSFINQVITNYSRANNKLLDAAFPIRIQDIFHVDRITQRVASYLKANPDVDTSKSTPVCYLKSVHEGGVQIAMTCIVRPTGGSEFYRVQQVILMRVAEIIVSEGASLGASGQWAPDIPPWAMCPEPTPGLLDDTPVT
ncbi:mechanosensitive ion channel protein 1/2/3 [Marchantia polymorpha subsp. ruderalis]|uniref:Mechanosensitive ion channel MscS domain-containing protein n=1 Tax=Marchantia polymorpha TaxID=3197 RepID=A0A2R6XSY0_MARPO|nr:hypothetical protein MARPO_0003s0092 [Marchantia polymorpha]|eukprot:PTQ49197.1 hypothetical protein MARPO_0003s0092 [Marchantia polymorpha]